MSIMDYAAWKFWFDVAQSVGTILIGVYVYFMTRKKALDKRFEKIEAGISQALSDHRDQIRERCDKRHKGIDAGMDRQAKAIAALERSDQAQELKIEHLPTHRDIKELSGRIDLLHGTLSELNGRLSGINRAVDLINEFLIKQGGKTS